MVVNPLNTSSNGRKSNAGSSIRTRYAATVKAKIITMYEMESEKLLIPQFAKKYNLPDKFKQYLGIHKGGWCNPMQRNLIMETASKDCYAKVSILDKSKYGKSPYQAIEHSLYTSIAEHRKKGRKVSRYFITITAKNLIKEIIPEKAESFKASDQWLNCFCERKRIKFRKRKSGKQHSGQDNIDKIIKVSLCDNFVTFDTSFDLIYLKFFAYFRHRVLAPHEGFDCPDFTLKWGRFPPHLHYNMDQVPLPFVVSQDNTYTTEDDKNVHVTAPSEALRKRQFTMHIIMNASSGKKRHGYTSLICKGSEKGRRKPAEKLAWNKKVPILFQKNAWADKAALMKIAREFVKQANKKHGDIWKVISCDNLKPQIDPEVKRVFF